jgi:hypothetical protein
VDEEAWEVSLAEDHLSRLFCASASQPPNQRLQLALPPLGVRPLAVLRSASFIDGEVVVTSFVHMTPALRRGAAETHNR